MELAPFRRVVQSRWIFICILKENGSLIFSNEYKKNAIHFLKFY